MANQGTRQAVVQSQAGLNKNLGVESLALFNPDGTPRTGADQTYAPVVTGSAIGTVAKTTTAPEPKANTLVMVKMTNGNSAATPTLAFNGGTARAMQLGGTASAAAKLAVAAGGVVPFFFDGTILHQIGAYT